MIYLDQEGADGCMTKIQEQIEVLTNAGTAINNTMAELAGCWKGNSADTAQTEYADNYQAMLTQQIPEMVAEFKQFMLTRVQALIDADA